MLKFKDEREKSAIAVAGLALLAAIASAVFTGLYWRSSDRAVGVADQARKDANTASSKALAVAEHAREDAVAEAERQRTDVQITLERQRRDATTALEAQTRRADRANELADRSAKAAEDTPKLRLCRLKCPKDLGSNSNHASSRWLSIVTFFAWNQRS